MNRLHLNGLVIIPICIILSCGDEGSGPNYPILKTGSIRQITHSDKGASQPAWSVGGEKIIYIDGPTISSIAAEGGTAETLYTIENESISLLRPRWRPGTGQRSFAFIQMQGDYYSIGVSRPGVGWIYRTNEEEIRCIDFTPDGEFLLFSATGGINKINVETGHIELIPNDIGWESLDVNDFSCDPDGETITYYVDRGLLDSAQNIDIPANSLLRIPLTGGDSELVFDPEDINIRAIFPWHTWRMPPFRLSPDLNRMAVISTYYYEEGNKYSTNVFLIDITIYDVEIIAQFQPYMYPDHPAWSPDGKSIALDFSQRHKAPRNIYVINLQG